MVHDYDRHSQFIKNDNHNRAFMPLIKVGHHTHNLTPYPHVTSRRLTSILTPARSNENRLACSKPKRTKHIHLQVAFLVLCSLDSWRSGIISGMYCITASCAFCW
ncbi:hypothetical protein NPIL_14531 [Nephila pilipes]|uniref:Uncharacterized protein n=1 Tax=Nephila pilipes TaxID=299642 RepID=A0A8X6QV35_NEPPI|nr:hypothetical protein NPIL_14531 [Nephila pilipes]